MVCSRFVVFMICHTLCSLFVELSVSSCETGADELGAEIFEGADELEPKP